MMDRHTEALPAAELAGSGHPRRGDEAVTGVGRTEADEVALREAVCVICAAPTDEVETCCSLACAQQAKRELQRNVARIRRMARHVASNEARRRVAERNGRLSSALLRWRPEAAERVAEPG
jgi:hypothetical protein